MTVGVDTGGTFTDFVWVDGNGRFHIHKQPSTRHDPSEAIVEGIAHLAIPATDAVVHGTTVATNALLERRGAKTALITTKGFADVLAIGRQNRPDIYALVPQKPPSLIPASLRLEVNERITAQGEVLWPLDLTTLDPLIAFLQANQVESVAICLLFSFLYPAHEQAIRDYLQDRLPIPVSLSSDILPEYREYERTATTVINAYVSPIMGHYLARLAEQVAPRKLSVMQSNGGVMRVQTAVAQAARTALSGPAGGVVGARFVAGQAGIDRIITFDMGGTSTDVALCPQTLPTTSRGQIADLPLRLPIIDIHTVGAGGGSIAYVDAGGALHVGPESAGSDPGPACYQTEIIATAQPTVTDANLLLGRLSADRFLGGEMALNVASARGALGRLGQKMGNVSAETAAWGVIQVANANMERAIRKISVERGHDPRAFTLIPFGGAGSLHACELAQNLGIPRVLIPPTPGVLSALGMLVSAPTKDFSKTAMLQLRALADEGLTVDDWVKQEAYPLAQRAREEMLADGFPSPQLTYALDMRYVGQSHELTIPFEPSHTLLERFHATHEARFGYRNDGAEVELVTVRVTAVAPHTPPPLHTYPRGTGSVTDAILGSKLVWFAGEQVETMLYDRTKLQADHRFSGPAIIFQYDTTIVVPSGWQTAVDNYHNLMLEAS